MRRVHLLRAKSDGKQTLGAIVANSLNEVFVYKSLELAWSNNSSNISCIPIGDYVCKWTRSNRLSALAKADVYTYEVLGVPDRAGIRIHSANYFTQIQGCIALGDSHKDINMDGRLDAIHSGDAVKEFNKLMQYSDFTLVVRNIESGL